jgi:hypothetical protein
MEEIKLILASLNKDFPWDIEYIYDLNAISWEKLLILAKENNLLYLVSNFIYKNHFQLLDNATKKEIEKIISNGKDDIQCIRDAVNFLNADCSFDLVLHKTYRAYDRIPSDLDFIVDDYDSSCAELTKSCGSPAHVDKSVPDANFYHQNGVKLHLHKRVGWLGKRYMDDDLYLKDVRKVIFNGVEVKIPGYDADYLIHLAHMNFEPLHFTLSDLVYLHSIWHLVDHDFCKKQSKKYRWLGSFNRTEKLLNEYRLAFFDSSDVVHDFNFNPIMPKTFSRFHMILSFLEKGIILEPLKKFPKVLKVLFSGDSYKGFYTPPENKL